MTICRFPNCRCQHPATCDEETNHKPEGVVREHLASADCWCMPEVNYVDPTNGTKVYVHRRPQ